MLSLDSIQTPILSNPDRKQRILSLLEAMTADLPPTIKMIVLANRGSAVRLLDEMTEEQIDEILDKAQDIIAALR